MPDDADNNPPAFDSPDADRVYANYLETCRRLGVEPVLRERAAELIHEWAATSLELIRTFPGRDYPGRQKSEPQAR